MCASIALRLRPSNASRPAAQAVRRCAVAMGGKHTNTATARQNLACVLYSCGRTADSEAELRQALADHRLNGRSPALLLAQFNLACLLGTLGCGHAAEVRLAPPTSSRGRRPPAARPPACRPTQRAPRAAAR